MEDFGKELKKKISLIFFIAIIGAALGIPIFYIDIAIEFVIRTIPGLVFSLIASTIVEMFTGDLLKKFTLTVEIGMGIKFSLTFFAVATLFVNIWLHLNSLT